MNAQLFNLVEYGRVLSTRERGREAADLLQDALSREKVVVLSFEGVEVASPSFLDEILTRVRGVLSGAEFDAVVVVTGLNEDVAESLELVLERRKLALAVLDDHKLELLGGSRQLRETLVEASRLGTFKARDLAENLEIKMPNLHQRLKSLTEGGAVAKTTRSEPSDRPGDDFRTFDPETFRLDDLEPRKLVRN